MKIPTFPTIHWEEAAIPLTNSEVWGGERVRGVPVLTDDSGGVALLTAVLTAAVGAGHLADSWGEDHLDPSWVVPYCSPAEQRHQQREERKIHQSGRHGFHKQLRTTLSHFCRQCLAEQLRSSALRKWNERGSERERGWRKEKSISVVLSFLSLLYVFPWDCLIPFSFIPSFSLSLVQYLSLWNMRRWLGKKIEAKERERKRKRETSKQLWDQTQFFSQDSVKVTTTPSLIQRWKEGMSAFPN